MIMKPRSLGVSSLRSDYTSPPLSPLVVNTKVVNTKRIFPDEGRIGVYIGRPSPFGNPYRIGNDGTRADVIQKYELWIRERIAMEPELRDKVKALHNKVLICWCRPLPCHGDVLVKIATELNQ